MAEYSVNEFRANIRKAFNEADRGEAVYIERFDIDYILITKEEWNKTIQLAQKTGMGVLVTDGESSDVRPDMPLTPEEYTKKWNEAAKHTLNVPQLKDPTDV